MHWHRAIADYAARGVPYVIATVLATEGSTPRGSSSKMVITEAGQDDTIGGGQFEYLVIEAARELLARSHSGAAVHHFPLAAAATQCCGGSVTVLLESFAAPALSVVVFGAGHVGRRVVALLAELPIQLHWFDARPEQAAADVGDGLPPCELLTDAQMVFTALPEPSEVFILTHDHQLDFELLQVALRSTTARVGLIGSRTKAERFRRRLRRAGTDEAVLDRLQCPVGDPAVVGKEPMAIAVAIVADLLRRRPAVAEPSGAPRLSWRQLKQSLIQEPASS